MWQALHRISNAALNTLLKFLSVFISLISKAFAIDKLQSFAKQIPQTISRAHKLIWNTSNNQFIVYVVCPKCDLVYNFDDCVV